MHNIQYLPNEIVLCIFEKALDLSPKEALKLASTCKSFRSIYVRQEYSLLARAVRALTNDLVLETHALVLAEEATKDQAYLLRPLNILCEYLSKTRSKPTLEDLKRIVETYNLHKCFSEYILGYAKLCPSASVRGQVKGDMAGRILFLLLDALADNDDLEDLQTAFATKWISVNFYGDVEDSKSLEEIEKKLLAGENIRMFQLLPTRRRRHGGSYWPEAEGEISGGHNTSVEVMRVPMKTLPAVMEYYKTWTPHFFHIDRITNDFIRRATTRERIQYFEDFDGRDDLVRKVMGITKRDYYGPRPSNTHRLVDRESGAINEYLAGQSDLDSGEDDLSDGEDVEGEDEEDLDWDNMYSDDEDDENDEDDEIDEDGSDGNGLHGGITLSDFLTLQMNATASWTPFPHALGAAPSDEESS